MNEDLSLEIGRQLREQFFLLDRRLLVQEVLEMLPDSAGQGGNGVRRVCPSMRVRALACLACAHFRARKRLELWLDPTAWGG